MVEADASRGAQGAADSSVNGVSQPYGRGSLARPPGEFFLSPLPIARPSPKSLLKIP